MDTLALGRRSWISYFQSRVGYCLGVRIKYNGFFERSFSKALVEARRRDIEKGKKMTGCITEQVTTVSNQFHRAMQSK